MPMQMSTQMRMKMCIPTQMRMKMCVPRQIRMKMLKKMCMQNNKHLPIGISIQNFLSIHLVPWQYP